MNYEGDHSHRNDIDDPWFGRFHTDVTECHYRPVPSHASQDVTSPVPNFDRRATDVTEQLHSRPSSADKDYNYGKVKTDVTQHLHVRAPKFVNPHGSELEPYYGVQGTDITNYKICPIQSIGGPNLTDFMHPLGKHRPFPLTQMFFHDGSRSTSRSASPHRHNDSSPPRPPRHEFQGPRSRSPSEGCELPGPAVVCPPPLLRNRSMGPDGRQHSPPRSASPTKSKRSRDHRSPERSPRRSPTPGSRQQSIPSPFLNCSRACQLCPACPACQELLDSSYWKDLSAKDCGVAAARSPHCQFHGNSPCPVQAGLPCYGMRPWGPAAH